MRRIQIPEGIEHREKWENECLGLSEIEGRLFPPIVNEEGFFFAYILVRPTCNYLVMKLGMEFWDVCVRMSELYNAKTIKIRIGVTKNELIKEGFIEDVDFEERICSFYGPPHPYPAGASFTFNKMRDKMDFEGGNLSHMSSESLRQAASGQTPEGIVCE